MTGTDSSSTETTSRASELVGLASALEALTAAFPEPAYLMDTEGTIIAVNDAMCARSGLPRAAFVGSPFDQWVEPAARARIRAEFAAALAGETRRFRVDRRAAGDSVSRAEASNIPVRLGGEVVAVAGFAIDVTGAVTRERARARADNLLRIAGELASFGAWSLDRVSQRLTLTPQAQRILGYEGHDDIDLAEAIALFSPTNAGRIFEAVTACFERGEPIDLMLELTTADGRSAFVRVLGEQVATAEGESSSTAHGALWDITEAVEAREREALLQQRLDLTLDTIGDGMVFLDESWRITYANARAVELMARPFAEVVGRSMWECFPELIGTEMEEAYQRAARDQVRTTVRTNDEPSGSWFDITAYPTETGLALYVRDVTEDELGRV